MMMRKYTLANSHCWDLAFFAICISFFFAGFLPASVYLGNAAEFPLMTPTMLVGGMVLACTLLFIFIFAVLYLVRRLHPMVLLFFISGIIGLMIALYVQGNLINLNYGVMDGHEIDWVAMRFHGVVNTLVWLFIFSIAIGLFVFKREYSILIFKRIALVFTAYVLLITGLRFCGLQDMAASALQFTATGFDMVSTNRNVVVFIVDTLENSLFEQMLLKYPEVKRWLSDFTYYSNVIGKFPSTKGALPHIMTGVPNDNSRVFCDYKNYAFTNSLILKAAREQSYIVDYYTDAVFAPDERILPYLQEVGNVKQPSVRLSELANGFLEMFESVGFVYAPHFLKKYVQNVSMPRIKVATDGIVTDADVEHLFFKFVDSGDFKLTDCRSLRYYHTFGVHAPRYTVDRAYVCMGKIYRYIERLKELGLWENTAMVIMADHGTVQKERPTFLCNNSADGFKTSTQPVSYDSIPTIMCNLLSGNRKIPATLEPRNFQYYAWGVGDFSADYLPKLFSRYYDSNGNRIAEEGLEPKFEYTPPDFPRLQMDGIAVDGDYPDCWLWTLGTNSQIRLPIPSALRNKNMVLEFGSSALLGERKVAQRMSCTVNDIPISMIEYSYPQQVSCTVSLPIPKEVNGDVELRLGLRVASPVSPEFWSPPEYGARPLGVRISSFKLKIAESLSQTMGGFTFQDGFSYAEDAGSWTTEKVAHLSVAIPEAMRRGDVLMTWTLNPFVSKPNAPRQRLRISSCGVELFKTELTEFEIREIQFTVPSACMRDGSVTFVLDLPDTVSPAEVGFNGDTRPLGVFLRTCRVEAAPSS